MIGIIYRMEMLRNLKSFIIWTAATCSILFFGMMFYPAINSGDLLSAVEPVFKTPMMRGLLSAFGADLSELGNLSGYFVTYNSFYNILLGCIFAAVLATNLLPREEADKTADFLFTKPVSRTGIFFGKVAVMISYFAAFSVIFLLVSILAFEVVKEDAGRQLDISKRDKELVIQQVSANPGVIYRAFNLNEESFDTYALGYAAGRMAEGRRELADLDLDPAMLEQLLYEALENPENFFETVLNNPESYMEVFSIDPEEKSGFIKNVEEERREYLAMKKSFYESPDIFLMIFQDDPSLALKQFIVEPGSMAEAVRLLELPGDFEQRIFKKYSPLKLLIFCSYVFLLLLTTGSLVLFASLLMNQGASTTGFAVAFVFILYFLKSITGLAAAFSHTAEIIGFLSPFSWIDTDINALDYGFSWWRIVLFAAVAAMGLGAACLRLNKKDILV